MVGIAACAHRLIVRRARCARGARTARARARFRRTDTVSSCGRRDRLVLPSRIRARGVPCGARTVLQIVTREARSTLLFTLTALSLDWTRLNS